ncbi:toxin-antitoxin system YwqK family antitoxin [Spirochaetota bacterium]
MVRVKSLALFLIVSVSFAAFFSCASKKKKFSKIKNGPGKIYWDDKSLKGQGNFVNNSKEGKWILFYQTSGEKMGEGIYLKNKQSGKWAFFHKNGKIRLKGVFDDAQKKGPWEARYDSGELFWKANYNIITFVVAGMTMKSGALEGEKITYYKSGKTWKKEFFKKGKKTGKSIELYEDGKNKEISNFSDGKDNGKYTKWFPNGKVSTAGSFVNGKKNGTWKNYFINGKLSSTGSFLNGSTNGKWRFYSKVGLLQKEGNFLSGKESGLWSFYEYVKRSRKVAMALSLNGGMISGGISRVYKNGKLKGQGQLRLTVPKGIYGMYKGSSLVKNVYLGQVPQDIPKKNIFYKWTGKWKDVLPHGKWTEYYPDGKSKKSVAEYMMGKKMGAYKEYHRNGRIKAEGEYMNNKMNGMWKFYDEDGSPDNSRSGRYMFGKKSRF